MEEACQTIFGAALESIDEPVVEHIVTMVADAPPHTARELYHSIGELLVGYEAVVDDPAAEALCEELMAQLTRAGVCEEHKGEEGERAGDNAEEMKWVVATENLRPLIRSGIDVKAFDAQDEEWLDATVLFAVTMGRYKVRFKNSKEVTQLGVSHIKIEVPVSMDLEQSLSGNATKLLAAPVRLADLSENKREKKKEGVAKDYKMRERQKKAWEDTLRKKEAEEKRKWDAMVAREQKRRDLAEKRKEESFHTYLQSRAASTTRNTEVWIGDFSMGTEDGGAELIADSELKLAPGHRYGLIGRNGAGKTTLLRHIGCYEIDRFPKQLRVVHVEQEIVGDDTPVLEAVLKSDMELAILKADYARLTGERKQGEEFSKEEDAELANVIERLEDIDADGAEARASTILAGLGFTVEMCGMKTRELSGGWRMRVALSQALFISPDILMLDEPTNHLDFPAVIWLEEYLLTYEKTLLVVSHDRVFLNNIITDVVFLHNKKLQYYKGNYDTFETVREDQFKQQRREYEADQAKRAHIQKFIDKFRFNAKRATLVQSRIKALNRMAIVEDALDDPAFQFTFPDPEPLQHPSIIECKNISFSYSPDSPVLLNDVTFNIDSESRIGIMGANGAGKTTLINLMLGKLEPTSGEIHRNGSARISLFSQHHVDALQLHLSAFDQILKMYPDTKQGVVLAHLARYGITASLAAQPLGTLSGGQKSRVAFSLITWDTPHLIVMDEPTNHLDLETIEALIQAVICFKGACIIVSHDQHFLRNIAKQYWAVHKQRVANFHEFKQARDECYSRLSKVRG